jgi:hypothetical protein
MLRRNKGDLIADGDDIRPIRVVSRGAMSGVEVFIRRGVSSSAAGSRDNTSAILNGSSDGGESA